MLMILYLLELNNYNSAETPATQIPLGSDPDGKPFQDSWNCSSIVGMLLYLAGNTRPDIAFAVHQVARFAHGIAAKRILRYLFGTKHKGLILEPTSSHSLNCHVDADFAGTYTSESHDLAVSVKSRTGYVILYKNCPLIWVSKLQSQIALSTMESEYIALSQAMRDLIPLRKMVKSLLEDILGNNTKHIKCTINSNAKDNIDLLPSSIVYKDNTVCISFARLPRIIPRTKHIALPYHWFRSKGLDLNIVIERVSTTDQLADQCTKGLPSIMFCTSRKILMGW
jgi:hypothetical protein